MSSFRAALLARGIGVATYVLKRLNRWPTERSAAGLPGTSCSDCNVMTLEMCAECLGRTHEETVLVRTWQTSK